MAPENAEIEWHPEILTAAQKRVLEAIGSLMARWQFYLAGGTAVALYLGHRRSVDFDWFTSERMEDPLRLALAFQTEGYALTEVRVEKATFQTDGHRTLYEEQAVEFEMVQGPKGWQAQNVTPK